MTKRKDGKEPKGAAERHAVERRTFITGSVASTAAAGIAAATLGGSRLTEPETPDVDDRRSGYRETEHIRQFYRVSRF